jgi:hypothetical protein
VDFYELMLITCGLVRIEDTIPTVKMSDLDVILTYETDSSVSMIPRPRGTALVNEDRYHDALNVFMSLPLDSHNCTKKTVVSYSPPTS